MHKTHEIEFTVAGGVVSGDVSGQVGVFGSSATYLPTTTRLDLRGTPFGGGTLVLEGHVVNGGYGLFWDQSGVTAERPMNGGVYMVLRR